MNDPMPPAGAQTGACSFAATLAFDDLPADVVVQAQRCLLDLLGVALAGARTPLAGIVTSHAVREFGTRERGARIMFDGRRASASGAAFAGGAMIDAFDAHDGHVLTKGHAGVAVLPAILAMADTQPPAGSPGREWITSLVAGYEIATRAGIALHTSVADYHCSGAWNAIAAALVSARLLGLDEPRMRHAAGIAEYFGPRGQMLRVCAAPTMLKDGSGWGAHAGVSAALLARDGFTGAPAVTLESAASGGLWRDLGRRWRIREQYFKAYPVCRWAQPAIEAALALCAAHGVSADDVAAMAIESFREAIVLGSDAGFPRTTEEAQYSLTYPVAAAVVFGRVGAEEVGMPALHDARLERLCARMTLHEDRAFSQAFPEERWARVRMTLRDGRVLVSDAHRARGGPENPLSDDELRRKYRELATPVCGSPRAARIEALIDALAVDVTAAGALLDEVLSDPRPLWG